MYDNKRIYKPSRPSLPLYSTVYTLDIHCSGSGVSVCPVCMPSVPSVYPLYTVSVRPMYTDYTELGSGTAVITERKRIGAEMAPQWSHY